MILVACLAWGQVGEAAAQPTVALTDATDRYRLQTRALYYRDPTGELSLQAVRPQSERFGPAPGGELHVGYDGAAYWARFVVVDRSSAQTPLWVLEVGQRSLDEVDVFFVRRDTVIHQVSGDARPYGARPVDDRNLLFRIPAEPNEPLAVYVRVASHGPVSMPLTIWSAEAYNSQVQKDQLAFGVFFGGLLIIAIYNLLLFASIRDVAFLYYVLFLLSLLAHELAVDRFGFAYLWPDQLWWHARANSVLALLTGIFGIQFSRIYLDARHYAPALDRLLQGLIGISVLLIGLTVVHIDRVVNQSIALFMTLVVGAGLVVGVACWRRGNRAARFYLLAWGVLLLAFLVGMLSYFGLPGDAWLIVRVGALLEAILLSLGLGDRFQLLRQARERLQWKIAQDLHDDIGGELARVSGVALMMRRTAQRLQDAAEGQAAVEAAPGTGSSADPSGITRALTAQLEERAEQVGAMARSITSKMRDIVWAIKPEQETWADLEAYVRDAAQGLVGPRDIAFVMEGTVDGEPPTLSLDVRHHLVLIVKEAITNAVRHAGCSQITLTYALSEERLALRVSDDGQGFDPEHVARGNGLDSLARRAEAIGADLHLRSRPGGPTDIDLAVVLHHARHPERLSFR